MEGSRLTKKLSWKLLLVVFIGCIPFQYLRKLLYRSFLGYNIDNDSYIGFLNFILADRVSIEKGARLQGILNIALNVGQLVFEPYSKIGSPLIGLNFISGDNSSTLLFRRAARATWGHFFDVSDDITIGSMTIIGGKSCEFFTHDMFNGKRFAPISIGSGCYIGSSCKFAPGAFVSDRTVVAMGSVVTRKFDEGDILIGGVPADIVKESYGYDAKITYDKLDLPY